MLGRDFDLQQKIYKHERGSKSIFVHLSTLKGLWDEFVQYILARSDKPSLKKTKFLRSVQVWRGLRKLGRANLDNQANS